MNAPLGSAVHWAELLWGLRGAPCHWALARQVQSAEALGAYGCIRSSRQKQLEPEVTGRLPEGTLGGSLEVTGNAGDHLVALTVVQWGLGAPCVFFRTSSIRSFTIPHQPDTAHSQALDVPRGIRSDRGGCPQGTGFLTEPGAENAGVTSEC